MFKWELVYKSRCSVSVGVFIWCWEVAILCDQDLIILLFSKGEYELVRCKGDGLLRGAITKSFKESKKTPGLINAEMWYAGGLLKRRHVVKLQNSYDQQFVDPRLLSEVCRSNRTWCWCGLAISVAHRVARMLRVKCWQGEIWVCKSGTCCHGNKHFWWCSKIFGVSRIMSMLFPFGVSDVLSQTLVVEPVIAAIFFPCHRMFVPAQQPCQPSYDGSTFREKLEPIDLCSILLLGFALG